jgi:hypothetical protein
MYFIKFSSDLLAFNDHSCGLFTEFHKERIAPLFRELDEIYKGGEQIDCALSFRVGHVFCTKVVNSSSLGEAGTEAVIQSCITNRGNDICVTDGRE